MKLDKVQIKILISAAIVAIGIWIFCQFIYFPKKAEMKELTKQYNDIVEKIRFAKENGNWAEQSKENFALKRDELSRLNKLLPPEDHVSEIIHDLTLETDALGIDILSIDRGESRYLTDKTGAKVKIYGAKCLEVPVEVILECGYVELGMCLEVLQEKFTTLATIEELEINKNKTGAANIKARLVIVSRFLDANQ